MLYQVSWSRLESGETQIVAGTPHQAALLMKGSLPNSNVTITGVEFGGDYHSIYDWCESCGLPIFEDEPYTSDGEVYLCKKCGEGLRAN